MDDFGYSLPVGLIAQSPAVPKDSSRLLVIKEGSLEHRSFTDLPDYLGEGDVLVINETRVSRARIKGCRLTGGSVEITVCQRRSADTFTCRIAGHRIKVGDRYLLRGLHAEVIGKEEDIFTIRFREEVTERVKESCFELPLPPYIRKKLDDDEGYQTVYSARDGSLAAPTAGLHFTERLLKRIGKKGIEIVRICLHVDFGTFLPVTGDILNHKMHKEQFSISRNAADAINNRKGRLFCVGTTSIRALESAADDKGKVRPMEGETDLFIYPGYRWKNDISGLVTNFHLPGSTLIMLTSAFIGRERLLDAYAVAVKKKYRFYSLGDATLLLR